MTDAADALGAGLYDSLLAHLPGMLYRCRNDRQWTLSYVSAGCHDLTGYPPEALVGETGPRYAELIHPDDRDAVWAQVQQALTNDVDFQLEYRIRTASGQERWVWEHGHAIDGDGAELFGFVLDITERKRIEAQNRAAHTTIQQSLDRAERSRRALLSVLEDAKAAESALREREARYRGLVESMSDGVAVYEVVGNGEDFRFKEYNHAAEQIGGIARAQIIGRLVREVFPAVESMGLFAVFQRVWRSGEPEHHPSSLYQDAPLSLWLENYVFKIPGGEIVAIYQDNTQRKQAELALRASEEKYRLLVDNQMDLVVKIGAEGRFEFVSPSYCRLFGKSEAELLGQTFMPLVHEDDRASTAKAIEALFAPPYVAYVEQRAMTINGWRWLGWMDTAITDRQGQVTAIIGVGRDITERKGAEEEILRLNAELEQRVSDRTAELQAANEALESFVYSVSHDLRAPLRAVTGFAQILARRHRDALNDEGRHYLDNVVDAGSHMGTLIDDLLDYSRLGRGAIRLRPVELAPIIEGLQSTFGERIAETRARIQVLAPLATPLGDPTLIGQVLNNLLDNALIYRRGDEAPDITIAAESHGSHIQLSVADQGIGIDSAYHDKIFKVFQRLHDQDSYPGTGIGLAIVSKAAHLMNGEVRVESSPGSGSRFTVTLPAATESA
ncbi:PAS domain-containing sensor histidine kinase [Thiocystis violacea]|uniref:PAS domain-containing sensor histidine kinase n=1 Tax=Thiocystis violacea TaxID=13725 RepID=UPI001902F536|nr:PAS domain S-box protein [Thiocystis violacea]